MVVVVVAVAVGATVLCPLLSWVEWPGDGVQDTCTMPSIVVRSGSATISMYQQPHNIVLTLVCTRQFLALALKREWFKYPSLDRAFARTSLSQQ